jgi:hypothetical protein
MSVLALVEYARMIGLPPSEPEYEFALPERFWRFDLAFPSIKVAVEIEGGIWTGGRHTRGRGFLADIEKYNHATLLGWRLLRVTPQMIADGQAFVLLDRLKECVK